MKTARNFVMLILGAWLLTASAGAQINASNIDSKTREQLTAIVNETASTVVAIVGKEDYKEKRDKYREDIRVFLLKRVDMDRVGLLTLAMNKKKFSDQEFEQFKDSFSRLLFTTYIDRMETSSAQETLQIRKFVKLSKTSQRVQVQTHSVNPNSSAKPLDVAYNFFLNETSNDWRVDDIKVEGVSLVSNYRTQFAKILAQKTPAELIEQIQTKVKDNETKS